MKDLPILWLIFNTKIGRAIVCIILAGAFIQVAGWWVVPIMSAVIATFLLDDYTNNKYEDKKTKKIKLVPQRLWYLEDFITFSTVSS